jgi:hypothetical protein
MGYLITDKKSTKEIKNNVNNISNNNIIDRNVLYKPISQFSWKDANYIEIHKEALPHYGVKFAL